MYSNSRTFFGMDGAKVFVEYLRTQHVEDMEIRIHTDAFGQAQYTVWWNI